MNDLQETAETKIALAKIQTDLARFGLKGTLIGSSVYAIAFVAIVCIETYSKQVVIGGWAFTAMVASVAICVMFYGAFIFNRALSVTGAVGKRSTFSAFTRGSDEAP